jgi:hypothetical protein
VAAAAAAVVPVVVRVGVEVGEVAVVVDDSEKKKAVPGERECAAVCDQSVECVGGVAESVSGNGGLSAETAVGKRPSRAVAGDAVVYCSAEREYDRCSAAAGVCVLWIHCGRETSRGVRAVPRRLDCGTHTTHTHTHTRPPAAEHCRLRSVWLCACVCMRALVYMPLWM